MPNNSELSRRDVLLAARRSDYRGGRDVRPRGSANDSGGDLGERRRAARHLRVSLAEYYSGRPLRHHPTNGDEEELSENGRRTYIGNYSKGLPHNDVGEVDHAAYQKSAGRAGERRSRAVRADPARGRGGFGEAREPAPGLRQLSARRGRAVLPDPLGAGAC